MAKLHHTEYKKNYKNYILDCLDNEDEIIESSTKFSRLDKIDYLVHRFYTEYGFMINRVGKQKAIANWLSGLAINIVYWNEDIIQLAKDMGSVDESMTRRQEETILTNYWSFMANIIILLEQEVERVA
jgi:hypothetical protein